MSEDRQKTCRQTAYELFQEKLKLRDEIDALQTQLEQAQARIGELEYLSSKLVRRYISNSGTNHEFISCATPEKVRHSPENQPDGVWADWKKLETALSKDSTQSLADIGARAVEKYKSDIKHQSRKVINASNPTDVFEAVPLKAIDNESQQAG